MHIQSSEHHDEARQLFRILLVGVEEMDRSDGGWGRERAEKKIGRKGRRRLVGGNGVRGRSEEFKSRSID